jgi:hypothetical protein
VISLAEDNSLIVEQRKPRRTERLNGVPTGVKKAAGFKANTIGQTEGGKKDSGTEYFAHQSSEYRSSPVTGMMFAFQWAASIFP